MLALVFIDQIIVIIPGSFVEFPLVLECLCFPAFVTAQFIAQTFGKEKPSAYLAFPEMQPPVIQAVQVIGDCRVKGCISSNALRIAFIVRIP